MHAVLTFLQVKKPNQTKTLFCAITAVCVVREVFKRVTVLGDLGIRNTMKEINHLLSFNNTF